ncbi:MAG: 3-keto-disaccharide hydrolase [Chitinophagaceae bacterium]
MRILLVAFFTAAVLLSQAQEIDRSKGDPKLSEYYNPEAPVITPGKTAHDAPSDAIILFDGKSFSNWEGDKNQPIGWTMENGAMVVKGGSGGIKTKRGFGDCQMHIEFRTPAEVKGDGQGRGNSGIFLMGKYELQVLDNYNNKTYVNGQAGSMYKQLPPMVNACRPPGEWQTYDIIFTAPRFYDDGRLKSQARITVIHNGVLVQNNTTIWGSTEYIGSPVYKKHSDKEPIFLQDHGNPTAFRNIWIREL